MHQPNREISVSESHTAPTFLFVSAPVRLETLLAAVVRPVAALAETGLLSNDAAAGTAAGTTQVLLEGLCVVLVILPTPWCFYFLFQQFEGRKDVWRKFVGVVIRPF